MRRVLAACWALIQSYNKDLDPLDRLVLRNRFPPWWVFAFITWGVFVIMSIVLLWEWYVQLTH